jgi:site-specific DNA-methyltransferase (adenine-specific)
MCAQYSKQAIYTYHVNKRTLTCLNDNKENYGEVRDIPLDRITIPRRKRQIDDEKVEDIVDSINNVELIQPIIVTPKGKNYELVAGAHRYRAFKLLGRKNIPAITVESDAKKIELIEIDENLIRNELTALERAEHLTRRDELLKELGQRARSGQGRPQKNPAIIAGFKLKTTSDIARETGRSVRSVQTDIQIYKNIDDGVKRKIRGTPLANIKTELFYLSQLDKLVQLAVVEKIICGEAKKVKKAAAIVMREMRLQGYIHPKFDSDNIEPNKLYCIDCRKGFELMDDKTVDVILTSPPYNIGADYREYDDSKPRDEYLGFMDEVAKGICRVLRDDGSLYLVLGFPLTQPLLDIEVVNVFLRYFVLQNRIIWAKSVYLESDDVQALPVGHFKPTGSNKYHYNAFESIYHFTKHGDVEIDKLGTGVPYADKTNITRDGRIGPDIHDRGNVWFLPYDTVRMSKIHPATFPVKLAELCIRDHGIRNGMLVLDPFIGIGTTALACKSLGVQYIGFDTDQAYIAKAIESLKKIKSITDGLESNYGDADRYNSQESTL